MRHAPKLCRNKPNPLACLQEIKDQAELNRAIEKERWEQERNNNAVIALVTLGTLLALIVIIATVCSDGGCEE